MSRRMSRRRDGRNPYGSRGGYVTTRRRDRRSGRMGEHTSPQYDSRHDYNYDSRYDSRMDGNYPMEHEQYDYHNRPMEFYGIGGMYRPDYRSDYRYDRRDRMYDNNYYEDYASEDMEKEYEEDLHEWINKLKKYDKYGLSKEQLIQQAKNMGVKFKDYDEMEFYAVYLMMISDYPSVGGDYPIYIQMAKDFLEDEDSALKGSDKVCEYLYKIVLDEEE